jgi:hypothetical protein
VVVIDKVETNKSTLYAMPEAIEAARRTSRCRTARIHSGPALRSLMLRQSRQGADDASSR